MFTAQLIFSLIMGSVTLFSCKKLVLFVGSFSLSVSRIVLTLFTIICAYLFRLRGNGGSLKNGSDQSEVITQEINQKGSNVINSSSELEPQSGAKTEQPMGFTESENEREEVKLELSFQFRFPTFEEFITSQKEKNDLVDSELVSSARIGRCEFISGKSCSGFIEEPEVLRFDVKQITNVDSCGTVSPEEDNIFSHQISSDAIFKQPPAEALEVIKVTNNDEKTEATDSVEEIGEAVKEQQKFTNEVQLHPEASDWDSESVDSYGDAFLSDDDFGGEFEMDALIGESEDFVDEEDNCILEELGKLEVELEEEQHINDGYGLKSGFLSEQDFINEDLDRSKHENFDHKEVDDGSYDSEKVVLKEDSSESGDANELETLWEHQELIEQLKMELRKVKATGLPTILEESESPKITEDLKPWKIDEKFQHEECMDELHKFYKSYRERMRKFDIFNYQKMYAIGFLQLKDPLPSSSSQKSSGPALKSLLSQKIWHLKHRICDGDPMVKFMKELQSDLEVVYVGQMCLSWEFLHWQYGKALDLWDSDPHLIRQYNEVATEFQQFQVLLQRFVEDDPFQGPRVQNYTKSRCVNRYLLQVPVIREDNKDRKRGRKGEGGQHATTGDMLVEMVEESIRILWRFIRTDKDSCCVTTVKCHKAKPIQLQNPPSDLELLTEVRKILQKKEKKLKDAVRSGNCILKRFRKCREDDSGHVLYFFSQVDMKLVRRVLNMSKITTEQLVWCRSKLSKISFVEQRKIQVEPSFLLFPC